MSTPITVNGNILNAANEVPSQNARFTNYLYIKGHGPINMEQKRELARIGVTIFEYIGDNTYICRYEPTDLKVIQNLSFVEHANVYHNRLKTSPFLDNIIRANEQYSSADSVYKINVVLHKGEDATEKFIANLIEKTGISQDDVSVEHNTIRLMATAESIAKIEKFDAVQLIEEFIEKAVDNNIARQDLQISDTDVSLFGTAYEGNGQVIAVADTGFDIGSTKDIHPAFEGRVLALISEGRSSTSGKTNDFEGHGTHVAGSVLGDGTSDIMGGNIRGTAPKAKLVFQSLLKDEQENRRPELWTPPNLWDLFKTPYELHQARIATNSWGPDWGRVGRRQVQYNSEAGAIDRFVWHNQDHVILFSAGNSGSEFSATYAHIGGNSAAKNSICVGATESSRGSTNFCYDPDKMAGNPKIVAAFSSRGPTLEERIKPDVVAPGVAILSAASRDKAIDVKRRNKFGPTKDNLWMFSSGTSMSTPLVAGCCAVLREALQNLGLQTPSAALIKALLVNGAVDLGLSPVQQGFGRVDLQNSLVSVEKQSGGLSGFADVGYNSGNKLQEGQTWTHEISMPGTQSSGTLRVTMAYSDRYGSALQNNLSLKVQIRQTDGTVIEQRGDEDFSAENNVENVVSKIFPGATAVFTVTADRIARLDDSQTFAIVWAIYQ